MVTIALTILMFIVLLLLKMYHSSVIFNVSMLGLYGICYGISAWMQQVPCIIITKMIPKSSQGYVQGILQAFFRIGCAAGFLVPPQVYSWFMIDVSIIVIVAALLMICLILRKKHIINPKLLFEENTRYLFDIDFFSTIYARLLSQSAM